MSEPRAELAKALTGYLSQEQLSKLIDEVLAIEKRKSAEFTCKKCGQRQMQWTVIPDASAVTRALTDLMSQAFGRPQEASAQTDPIRFYRLTRMEEADALRLVKEDWGGHETERPEDAAVRPGSDGEGEAEAERDPDLQSIPARHHPKTPGLRTCVRCNQVKPDRDFPAGKRGPQICLECRA